jgi:hypothetical protein
LIEKLKLQYYILYPSRMRILDPTSRGSKDATAEYWMIAYWWGASLPIFPALGGVAMSEDKHAV